MSTREVPNCVTPIQLPVSNSPFGSEIGPDIELRDREIRPVNSAMTILTEAGELTDRGRNAETHNILLGMKEGTWPDLKTINSAANIDS